MQFSENRLISKPVRMIFYGVGVSQRSFDTGQISAVIKFTFTASALQMTEDFKVYNQGCSRDSNFNQNKWGPLQMRSDGVYATSNTVTLQ